MNKNKLDSNKLVKDGFTIERTGKTYSMSASQFIVTYPDSYKGEVWSPPWHELTLYDEIVKALEFAKIIYEKKHYKKTFTAI